jgi:acetate kinase
MIVNAGSSSLKLRVLDPADTITASADLPGTADPDAVSAAVSDMVTGSGTVDAVGHRVVHGGTAYSSPVLIDASVRRRLEALTDLAPLHQPKSLAALDAVSAALPDTPAVACFDTAFHATLPAAAATYALPEQWRARWTLRRYGFHGLSHAYVSRRVISLLGSPSSSRVVTCHLGAGASLAAVRDGASADTTMGFTPQDGLVMATRSGSVDPGLVLWLAEHARIPPGELAAALEHRSGLAGLTGSSDMREVLIRASAGNERAVLGRDVYLHRLRGSIAAMAASLGGLDALVFTGGVGENSPEIRARACAGLSFLGVSVSDSLNDPGNSPGGGGGSHDGGGSGGSSGGSGGSGGDSGEFEITADGAAVRTFVIAAREDRQIAAEVRSVLSRD